MLPQRISFLPSVGRSLPSDLLRAMPGHWQLRELAGAYVNGNGRSRFHEQLLPRRLSLACWLLSLCLLLFRPSGSNAEAPPAGLPAKDEPVRITAEAIYID